MEQIMILLHKHLQILPAVIAAVFILVIYLIHVKIFRKRILDIQTQKKNMEQQVKTMGQQVKSAEQKVKSLENQISTMTFNDKSKIVEETRRELESIRIGIDVNRMDKKPTEILLKEISTNILEILGKLAVFLQITEDKKDKPKE